MVSETTWFTRVILWQTIISRVTFVLFVILFLTNGYSYAQSDKSYTVREDSIMSFDKKQYPFIVEVAPYFETVAIAFRKGKKRFVWSKMYGKSKSYERIHRIQFSPDGKHLAFMAEKKRHYYIVVDGKEYGRFNTLISDSVIFSPNSERFAFLAGYKSRADKEDFFAIIDGKKQKKFDNMVYVEPVFSPDSKHLIYIAGNRKGHYAVIDGVKGRMFSQTGYGPYYSIAYSAFVFMGLNNDTAYLVANDSLVKGFYRYEEFVSSSGTSDFAYTAMPEKTSNRTVFLNNRPMTKYHASQNPRFSPDGKRFAFWASDGENQFAVVDSIEGQKYSAISDVRFSPGSRHYYYMVFHEMLPNRWSFVVDGEMMPEMSGTLENPSTYFSPDDSRWAIVYDVDTNDTRVLIDGKEYSGYNWVGEISFDDSSSHVAFIAEKSSDSESETVVFLDGKEIQYSDVVGPNIVFSSDGKNMLYWVTSSDSRHLLVNQEEVVSVKGNTFPLVLESNDEGDFVFYTFREKSLYKMTVSKW